MKRVPGDLPTVLIPHPHVRVDRHVLGGSPYVIGTRVPVRRLWGFYRNGAGVETLLKRYPQLGAGKVFDALAFAWDNPEVMEADLAREAQLLGKPATRPVDGRNARQMELPFSAAPAKRSAARPSTPTPPKRAAERPSSRRRN